MKLAWYDRVNINQKHNKLIEKRDNESKGKIFYIF